MVKIQVNRANGVHLIAIPKKICDALRWTKGMNLDWEILGKDKLKLERVKNPTPENTGGLYT